MKRNPLSILLLLTCLGALSWAFWDSGNRPVEAEDASSASVSHPAESVPDSAGSPDSVVSSETSRLVREQKSENPTEGGLVQVSSTSGLAVQEMAYLKLLATATLISSADKTPLQKNSRQKNTHKRGYFLKNFSFFIFHCAQRLAFHRIKKLGIGFSVLQFTHKEFDSTDLVHRL